MTRSASAILATQAKNLGQTNKKFLMRRMVELVFDLKKEMESNSIQNFGEILHENWLLKTQITNSVSNSQIDEWYSIGLKNEGMNFQKHLSSRPLQIFLRHK